jgi:hypothetical protein
VRSGSVAFSALLCVAGIAIAGPALAHGDEDHSHGAPEGARAPALAAGSAIHASSGETETFSVVVKYPARHAEGPLAVRVYVADAASSAPVEGASVRLELKGEVTADAEAKATGALGVYEATIPAPPDGAHADGIVSVQTKAAFDLVLLGKLSFGPQDPPPATAEAEHHEIEVWHVAAGALALSALAGTAGFAIGRRSRRPPRSPQSAPPEGDGANEKRTAAGATS